MADFVDHDANTRTLHKFRVHNQTILAGSINTSFTVKVDIPADHLIITVTDDVGFGIRIDRKDGEFLKLKSGTFTINCPIKNYIYCKVLSNNAFEVSIAFISFGTSLR